MALATRCPHCQTTFRVAHDQLKLRAGLVRCGACKEIFNGVEHLLRPDETQQALASSKPAKTPPQVDAAAPPQAKEAALPHAPSDHIPVPPPIDAPPSADASHADDAETARAVAAQAPSFTEDHFVRESDSSEEDIPEENEAHSAAHKAPSDDSSTIDPLQRMTLMDITAFDAQENTDQRKGSDESISYADSNSDVASEKMEHPDAGDELSQAIDSLQNKPWRSEKKNRNGRGARDGADKRKKAEPNFMVRARRQKRYGKAMRMTFGAGSAVLFLALLAQGVYAFRHVIAAEMPEYRPALTSLCVQIGCQVNLPAQIDKVSIESSELQSLPASPDKFTLVALLRNQATIDQAWPHLELTLNDMNEKPVARKVFQPKDYLPSAERVRAGFPEQSEQQVRIAFEMLQLRAAGYRLYLFYP